MYNMTNVIYKWNEVWVIFLNPTSIIVYIKDNSRSPQTKAHKLALPTPKIVMVSLGSYGMALIVILAAATTHPLQATLSSTQPNSTTDCKFYLYIRFTPYQRSSGDNVKLRRLWCTTPLTMLYCLVEDPKITSNHTVHPCQNYCRTPTSTYAAQKRPGSSAGDKVVLRGKDIELHSKGIMC